MTGNIDVTGLLQDLAWIAKKSSADDVLKECPALLALPPLRAVGGNQDELIRFRVLRRLLQRAADLSNDVSVKVAANLLLAHPGQGTKHLREAEAAGARGYNKSVRSVRRDEGKLLSAFLDALLDFLGDPAAVRIFVQETQTSLGLVCEAAQKSVLRAHYVHREQYERRFKKLVSEGAKLIALVGQPGMGKTWLADALMRQYEPAKSSTAWITFEADGSMSLGDLYVALKNCGLPIGALETGNPKFHLHRLLCDDEHAPRFVVLDNLPDTAILRSLLPRDTKSVVIATSRLKTRPPENCRIIGINQMTDDESRNLVKHLLPEVRQENELQLLLDTFQGFPLVAVFACRFIARKRISSQQFCDSLKDDPGSVLRRVPLGANQNLVSVLADVIDLLEEQDEAAFDLLECIVLAGTLNKVSQQFLKRFLTDSSSRSDHSTATNAVTYATALETLLDFCLIEEVDKEYVAMHSLTHYVLWELLNEDYRLVAERVTSRVRACAPEVYKREIDTLMFREEEYFFEQPIFYEVVDVCAALARLNSIIAHELGRPEGEKLYRDDLSEAQGKIAVVGAYACRILANQAVERVAEPLSAESLRAILHEVRTHKRIGFAATKSLELLEKTIGDLSDPKNIEFLGKVYKVVILVTATKGLWEEDSAQAYLLDAIVYGLDLEQRYRIGHASK